MMRVTLFVGFLVMNVLVNCEDLDLKHVKCLVCRTTMDEFKTAVHKADPNKLVETSSYRLDPSGDIVHKTIPLSRSEVHLSEILEKLCKNLSENYVRARKRSNKKLVLMNLFSPSGKGMNPKMPEVDIIQDADLNKSLEYYCNTIVEEFEEEMVSLYINDADNKKEAFCTDISGLCKNYPDDEDETDDDTSNKTSDDFSDREEL